MFARSQSREPWSGWKPLSENLAGLPQGRRRTHLETWLEAELKARFAGRILPIDAAITDRWGLIAAETMRRGKALSVIDGLLAATAVVSRNANDFMNTQVHVLNPWQA